MATRTSVGSGNWGTAGTWDTGIPADGDDVVIASGHTVTFNVDQSAFTTGIGLTITGTLTHTTTTGTYCLFAKTGASIVGAGTWNIGTSGTPIPFAAKHTITGAAGWYVDGNAGLTMTVYGAEPSIKYVKLSGAEASGQTELSVDTDVTGDIWAAGDTVVIAAYNNAEERVIAAGGIAEGAITVTAGLTGAKAAGDYLVLITRNVKIIAVGTGNYCLYRIGSTTNKLTIGGGMFYGVSKYMLSTCHYAVINGGAFTKNFHHINASNYVTINDGTFTNSNQIGAMSEGTINDGLFICVSGDGAFRGGSNLLINGGIFTKTLAVFQVYNGAVIAGGTFSYNSNAAISVAPLAINGGTFISNTTAISSTQLTLTGGTFTLNTRDLSTSIGTLHNVTLTSATEHSSYTSVYIHYLNCQSEDHDGVDGALKAWCKGGVVTSQTTVKPDGYTQAYLLDPESATYPVFFTKSFSVEPGKTVGVEVQLRKDASMTYLPRVYLMASIGNPLVGATPVDTFTMTDSTDTWETDTFTITNSTDYDQDYTLYFVAQSATDNAYAAYDITTAGGAGGAVSIRPIQGTVTL